MGRELSGGGAKQSRVRGAWICRILAKCLGTVVELVNSDFEASLAPDSVGLVIRVGQHWPKSRRRASIAHELGHSFFWNPSSLNRYVVYPPRDPECSWKEEDVCLGLRSMDVGARRGSQLRPRPIQGECPLPCSCRFPAGLGVSPQMLARRLLLDTPGWGRPHFHGAGNCSRRKDFTPSSAGEKVAPSDINQKVSPRRQGIDCVEPGVLFGRGRQWRIGGTCWKCLHGSLASAWGLY